MYVEQDCQSLYKQVFGKVTVFTASWASQMWVPFSLIAIISSLLILHLSNMVWEYDMVLWYIWYC